MLHKNFNAREMDKALDMKRYMLHVLDKCTLVHKYHTVYRAPNSKLLLWYGNFIFTQ